MHDENIAAANVFVDLKVELAVRKTFRIRFAHVERQMAANLFRQFGIRISRKDLDAAGCAHNLEDIGPIGHIGPISIKLAIQSWLGRVDSNQRMPVPKTGALPLGYAPVSVCLFAVLRERKKREPR